jgi:lipopolysaccharide/colanic/teichoic acid biosynthesis glycosyltransferase
MRRRSATRTRSPRVRPASSSQARGGVRATWFRAVVKRSLDLAVVVPSAIVALPIVLLSALWIVVVSPGNPFYYQRREGLNGREIKVWKLRTMFPDADVLLQRHLAKDASAREEWHTRFKLTRDPRILPGVGAFLRRTSLDELPQLWNIVRGDMSFVGPRPFPEYHLAAFDEEFRQLRRSVKPGLTGPWQIGARADGDLEVQRRLDLMYVENASLRLDLEILFKTPIAVLRGKGAY